MMTSLLPLQYVTPLTHQHQHQRQEEVVVMKKKNSRHNNNNSSESDDMYKLRNILLPVKRTTTTSNNNHNNVNRLAYVDALVDANALVIESIWQLPTATNKSAVVPLRTFIQEVLKRSRTTYSTLQTALFYLFRSRPEIKIHLSRMQHANCNEDAYISCGRRMFLASLVVASKFVQDKTYRNSAWAKIAGLPVTEINAAERIFLNLINYRLYISQPTFEQWHHLLHLHVEQKTLNQPTTAIHDFYHQLPFQPIDLSYQSSSCYSQHQHSLLLHQQQQQQETYYNNTSPTTTTTTTPLSSTTTNPSPPHTPSHHHYHHHHNHHGNHHYNYYNSNNHSNGWTIVLSPTTFLPANTTTSRKRRQPYPPAPLLSMSLPSSINSSPMQTPTQISPVRINNSHGNTSVFNWNNSPTTTSMDQNNRSVMNNNSSNNIKKRKYNNNHNEPSIIRSYNISHVRQSKRFHYC